MDYQEKVSSAIRIAKMYYYHDMTTKTIASELNVSRSSVSRLLSFAKQEGLVNIRINDPKEHPQLLENRIQNAFELKKVHVVPVAEVVGEVDRFERVAKYAAGYLNSVFSSDMILGVAWGTTMNSISRHLLPKITFNSRIVQLNGTGNLQSMGVEYASEIIMRFAQNYQASQDIFPVPTFFDFPETKKALWNESSIKRLLDMQKKADILLYSIGAVNSGIPSRVYIGGYLNQRDYRELNHMKIAGDIATVFFRDDGSFDEIPINMRASGPDLSLIQEKYGICVVSGFGKLKGLYAALRGKLMSELILDEPTAKKLVDDYLRDEKSI